VGVDAAGKGRPQVTQPLHECFCKRADTRPVRGWVFRSRAVQGDSGLAEVPLVEPVFQADSIRAVYEQAEPDEHHVKVSFIQ